MGVAGLRGRCCWLKYDRLAGYLKFEGGALINTDIKVRKNDKIREGHRLHIVLEGPKLDIDDQLTAFWRAAVLCPHKGYTKCAEPQLQCPVCPHLRSIRKGTMFDLGWPIPRKSLPREHSAANL